MHLSHLISNAEEYMVLNFDVLFSSSFLFMLRTFNYVAFRALSDNAVTSEEQTWWRDPLKLFQAG